MPASAQLFTLEAVNALLPRLRSLMATQMGRRSAIEDRLEELGRLVGGAPDRIEIDERDSAAVTRLKQELIRRICEYQEAWREVEEMGAVLKDARLGLVDFRGQVDGKLVWLCWKYGEEAVTHYHSLEEGFAGRKPIEATMRQRHLN